MAGHTVTVSVLADTRKFSRGMKELGNTTGLSKLGGGLRTAAKRTAQLTGALTLAGGAALGKFVSQAGDLEQSVGAVDTVFKKNAAQIHKWAKGAHSAVGLTQNSYNELATLMGTQLKNGGTALDEIGGKTNDLITLGADLSSMFGGDTRQAVEALSSALKGERDPIERYGVSLKQAAIDAKAAEMGFKKTGNSLSNEAQQAATLALIMEQTADAHGNFAKESQTLQGITQRLKARFTDITTTLGSKFLPVVAQAIDWVSRQLDPAMQHLSTVYTSKVKPAIDGASKWLKANRTQIQAVASRVKSTLITALNMLKTTLGTLGTALAATVGWIIQNKDWLGALAVGVTTMVVSYKAYVQAMAIWKAAVLVATGVQAAFNAVMSANPIGLIVLAIAGLVTGLVFFFTKTNTGKKIWAGFTAALSKGWEVIKKAFNAGVKGVGAFLSFMWKLVKTYFSFTPIGFIIMNWDKIMAFFRSLPTKIKTAFGNAKNMLKDIGQKIINGLKSGVEDAWKWVNDLFGGYPQKIKDTLGDLSRLLWNAGSQILSGLWDGMKSKFEDMKGWVTGIGDWIADHKGPKRYDLNLLVPAGKWIMQGLQDGMQASLPSLRTTLSGISSEIAGTTLGVPAASLSGAATRASALNITVNAGVGDPNAIAREIQSLLDRRNRTLGRS